MLVFIIVAALMGGGVGYDMAKKKYSACAKGQHVVKFCAQDK